MNINKFLGDITLNSNHEMIECSIPTKLIIGYKCISHNVEWLIPIYKLRSGSVLNSFKAEILAHLNLTEEEYIIKNIIE